MAAGAMTPFFPSPSLAAGYLVACLCSPRRRGRTWRSFCRARLRAAGCRASPPRRARMRGSSSIPSPPRSACRRCSRLRPRPIRRSKIAGALYLLWLAFRALSHGAALKLNAEGAATGGLRGAFLTGLLVNLTNPKIVLFFVTFLPQFIDARDAHASPKLFALGFGFIAITTIVNAAVILVAARFVAGGNESRARYGVRLRLRRADERFRRAARLDRSEIVEKIFGGCFEEERCPVCGKFPVGRDFGPRVRLLLGRVLGLVACAGHALAPGAGGSSARGRRGRSPARRRDAGARAGTDRRSGRGGSRPAPVPPQSAPERALGAMTPRIGRRVAKPVGRRSRPRGARAPPRRARVAGVRRGAGASRRGARRVGRPAPRPRGGPRPDRGRRARAPRRPRR